MKIDSLYPLKQGESKLWMVLIGVNHYQDESLPSLRFAVADCEGLTAALQAATRQFPRREILTHYGTAEQPLQQSDIERSLERLLDPVAGMMPEDILLFFFSGHGVLEPSTHQLYLGVSDTRMEHLQATGMAVSPLLQRFKASGVGQQVIILDACHSGQMHFTATLEATLQTYGSQSQDFQALLSCSRHDQTAWELEDLRHSAFTYALIAGIRGAAADEVGQIDVEHLYRYVRDRTHALVQARLGQQQIPSQIKVGCRDIIIGYKHPAPFPAFAVSLPLEQPLSLRQPLDSYLGMKSRSPRKPRAIHFSKFLKHPSIKIATGVLGLVSAAISGTHLSQQHTIQQTEQAQQRAQEALDRIRQFKAAQRYPECMAEVERFPPQARVRSAAQELAQQCQSAQSQAWLAQGQALAKQGKLSAAIAQFRQIPQQAALHAVAQQRIDQAAQRILAIAHKHYQKGELEQAIRLAQATPQSSVLYAKGQEKVQQWVQVWNKDKNHFAKATQAKAKAKPTQILKEGEQIKHPYWKQKVAPLVAETQVALQSQAIQRQSAIAAIAPPTYLAHVPVLAPANDPPPVHQPVPAPMNAVPARSRPPVSQPVIPTSASAEMERL